VKIYILEDDGNIRELVSYTLNHSGFEAQGFERPSLFWEAIEQERPDLLLLDIMLPEEDGLQVLDKLRKLRYGEDLPVILLTAKSSEYDKVVGLENGADDYLTKPFGMMELIARIKAVLRRTGVRETHLIQMDGISISPEKHEITADGEQVRLTGKEYELLTYLIENRDIVVSREQLLNRIWGYDFDGESRTVDVHIRSLRKKLGSCAGVIQTVRGFGYKAADSEMKAEHE